MLHDLQPDDPRLIGPYQLRGVLGAGGMGRVFLGASADDRLVAVKVIRSDLAADPESRAAFRREVEVARKVSGPFTAPVIDADLDGPVLWLATAYVAGSSLADAVTEHGPMLPRQVLALAAGLAEGLSAIHVAGVVHRDLKPSNVLLGPDGPRLIDFGISRACGAAALTPAGLMIGSPGFMSPEQAEGLLVGPPSDIFSLGAVLVFAATGKGPFGPGSTVALIYRVIHRPPNLEHVPREVRGLVERCLVKDPALRPAAGDLLAVAAAVRPAAVRPAAVRPAAVGAPEPPARAFTRRPLLAAAAEAETVPVPVVDNPALVAPDLPLSVGAWEQVPVAPARERPRRRKGRSSWWRDWRSLSAAAAIAALLGAAAGLVLTAAPTPGPAAQSQRQVASVRTKSSTRSAAARKTRSVSRTHPSNSASRQPHASPSPSATPTSASGGGY